MMIPSLDVFIRGANSDDASLLAELGARTFSETFAKDNTPEDMEAYLDSSFNVVVQTEELADPESIFLIAEIDGVPAGYAKLHSGEPLEEIKGEKPIELVRLYVSREWLGRGVGEGVRGGSGRDRVTRRACRGRSDRICRPARGRLRGDQMVRVPGSRRSRT